MRLYDKAAKKAHDMLGKWAWAQLKSSGQRDERERHYYILSRFYTNMAIKVKYKN